MQNINFINMAIVCFLLLFAVGLTFFLFRVFHFSISAEKILKMSSFCFLLFSLWSFIVLYVIHLYSDSFLIVYEDDNDFSVDIGEQGRKNVFFQEIMKLADNGNINSQYQLAQLYYKGDGVPLDYKEAFKWFHKVALKGFSSAQNMLGYMYYYGEGVEQDMTKAFEWYMKSALKGYCYGQLNVALKYQYGEGVEKNIDQAYLWFLVSKMNECNVDVYLAQLEKEIDSIDIDILTKKALKCIDSSYLSCSVTQ